MQINYKEIQANLEIFGDVKNGFYNADKTSGLFFEYVVKIPMGQHAMDVAWNLYNSFGVYLIFVFIGISYLTLFKRMSLLERVVSAWTRRI